MTPAQALGRLTVDQRAIRDAVRTLARERVAPRAAEIDRSAESPQDLRALLAELGILGPAPSRALCELLYTACEEIAAGAPDAARWSALCKLVAGDAAMAITADAVHVLGGYGYLDDYPVERMMRDAKITQLSEGNPADPTPRDRAGSPGPRPLDPARQRHAGRTPDRADRGAPQAGARPGRGTAGR